MYTVVSTCPVCREQMLVTQLRCRNCSAELHGNFELSRLNRLSQEQIHFVELLLKNRANVYRASEELGISYSTARGRLDEIVRSLGYAVTEPVASSVTPEQRRLILQALSEGKMSAAEAIESLGRR